MYRRIFVTADGIMDKLNRAELYAWGPIRPDAQLIKIPVEFVEAYSVMLRKSNSFRAMDGFEIIVHTERSRTYTTIIEGVGEGTKEERVSQAEAIRRLRAWADSYIKTYGKEYR